MKLRPEICDRAFRFSLNILKFCRQLEHDRLGNILLNQLLRSGTSIGANIEEAQAAQSKRDFIAKMAIARKEAKETNYWLRLLKEAEIPLTSDIDIPVQESDEITRVLSGILISAQEKQ